jgi:cardiolipin synthase A/B
MRRTVCAVAAIALIAGVTSGCKVDIQSLTASGSPSPGSGYTGSSSGTLPSGSGASGDYTLVTEPDQGLNPIYDLMRSAKHSLDMTMYELTDSTAEKILEQDAAKGVDVRVMLDKNEEGSRNQAAYSALAAHGVHMAWAPSGFTVTHQKTITVDGDVSAVLTLNLTSQYYSTSRDFAVIDRNPADVAAIIQVFDADFAGRSVGTPVGTDLVWSPGQSNTDLLALIASARKSLLIENEEMSDQAVVSALVAARHRGVRVEVVMTYDTSWKSDFNTLKAAGVKVVTYASSASLYIHAKVILVDYAPGAAAATTKMFLGSENFSTTSLERNRELGLILTDPAILSAVDSVVAKDYAGARPWTGTAAR